MKKYTKYIAANYAVRAFLQQVSESIDSDGANYDFKSICKEWDNSTSVETGVKISADGSMNRAMFYNLTGIHLDSSQELPEGPPFQIYQIAAFLTCLLNEKLFDVTL